jgi:hypothetical protein
MASLTPDELEALLKRLQRGGVLLGSELSVGSAAYFLFQGGNDRSREVNQMWVSDNSALKGRTMSLEECHEMLCRCIRAGVGVHVRVPLFALLDLTNIASRISPLAVAPSDGEYDDGAVRCGPTVLQSVIIPLM